MIRTPLGGGSPSLCAAAVVALAGSALAGDILPPQLPVDAHYRVVAMTGDPAPGGGTFSNFGAPKISAGGRVGFAAHIFAEVGPSGIWSEGASGVGNLELVAREGAVIPGFGGTFFGEFEHQFFSPMMNEDGDIAFGARLVGDQAAFGDTGIFTHNDGVVDHVALPGQIVPVGCNVLCPHFTNISNLPSMNGEGEVVFYATINGGNVLPGNNTGVWVGDTDGVTIALREGDAPPNTWDVVFGGVTGHLPMINDNGEIAVRNYLQHVDNSSIWSIWSGAPGDLSVTAAEGWMSPAGTPFDGSYFGFGNLSFNNDADITFPQTFSIGNDINYGLWLSRVSDPIVGLAFPGLAGPPGDVYAWPEAYGCQINDAGEIVFKARLAGQGKGPEPDALIRRDAGEQAEVFAEDAEPAPGMFAGTTYDIGFGYTPAAISNEGRITFAANVDGPAITDDNDRALWLTRPGDDHDLMLHKGQLILAGGEGRVVESFVFSIGSGPESGRRGAISELGQVALLVDFTDGTQAVIVATADPTCPGDLNNDGVIDSLDLNIVLGAFGTQGEPGTTGDADLDGDCDSADLNTVLGLFGTSCPDQG